ncbi:flagellar hook-length control protein FliK [soil metagenome]
MIPRADLTGTRPLGPVEVIKPSSAVADARQESFNRFAQIAIGKQFTADVMSRLSDGSYLVKIADTVARMNLPTGTRVGESITATLVSADPKPTFQVGPQGDRSTATLTGTAQLADRFLQMASPEELAAATGKSLPANLAAAAAPVTDEGVSLDAEGKPALDGTAIGKAALQSVGGKAALLTGAEPHANPNQAAAAPNSAPTSLSTTGRMISNILQSAQQSGAPASLTGAAPVVMSPMASPASIASGLQQALASSGLFYESHLAQWVNGERPAAALMQEPQAKTGYASAPAGSQVTTTPGTAQGQVQTLAQAEAVRSASPQDIVPLPLAAPPADAESLILANTMSPDAMRMINLQLATLENRQVMWQGEVWPGQTMEWEVSQDAPQRDADEAPPSWNSSVKFELPTLGMVSATIHLVGERVHVQIRTENETAAVALRAHGEELANALDAAGSPLDSLLVKHDGTS